MSRRKNKDWDSARRNSSTYIQYLDRLTELAVSMFEWKNLPDSIDERFLELCLFEEGKILFFEDDVLGYLTLQCTFGGQQSVYRIPKERRAFAINGYQRKLNENNSVIIYNNYLHTNSILAIRNFSERLYNLDRAIDVNANAQKTPILIVCDETQRLTMKNLYAQYEGNEPFIFGAKGLDTNSIKAFTTGAPFVADKLYELKTQIWNEALTYLGISNINIVKKERMITDEVTRNQGGTIASRHSRLQSRKQACEQINKMFGLNIDVDYREDYSNIVEDKPVTEGGEGNE